jgi:DNA-binding NarL/FixJ family response regulator
VIPVLIAAASAIARAGLKAVVEETRDCTVAGLVTSAELPAQAIELDLGVILWQLAPREEAAHTLEALGRRSAVLLAEAPASELLRAGASGVLPLEASPEQVGAALHAAAAGLSVFVAEGVSAMAAGSALGAYSAAAARLSGRETEVLRMIAQGLANKEIAYRLGLSEHTVKFHVSAVLGKLGVASRAEAVGAGLRQGIILL